MPKNSMLAQIWCACCWIPFARFRLCRLVDQLIIDEYTRHAVLQVDAFSLDLRQVEVMWSAPSR